MDEIEDRFRKSAENFSLVPSEGTWKIIEAEIRKRERRRRFIIFFLMGAAMVTGGIFTYFNFSDNPVELQKNNPEGIEQETSQQQPSNKHEYAENVNAVAPPALAGEKNPDDKSLPQENLTTTFISSREGGNNTAHAAQKTSGQHESLANNPLEPETTSETKNTISPVATSQIEPDSGFAPEIDTIITEAGKDSLLTAKSNTFANDTLVEMKDSIQASAGKNKWCIAIGVAPAMSFSEHHEKGDYQIVANYRDSSDKKLLTWNYHFTVSYRFIPRMEVFTGIGIINFEQEILSKQAVYRYDTSTIIVGPLPTITISRGYFNINGDSTGTVKNTFSWLEIPIGIRYDFLPNHKFNISLQPEVSFNKLMTADGYLYNDETFAYEKMKSSDLKSWLVSYGMGLSFQYAILKNLDFELMPCYKNFQESIFDEVRVHQRLQQLEFRLSLRYQLK